MYLKNEWDSDKGEVDNNIPWIWGTEGLEIKVECWMINGSAYKKASQISLHDTSKPVVKNPKFCTSEKWIVGVIVLCIPLGLP